ncbi:MAG: hypothetical protein OEW08_05000 [Gammaproteobacteria bacterium]|nr:hypothetical protein [Gammaproteobacteria bacterium]
MRAYHWIYAIVFLACDAAHAELLVLVSDSKPSMSRVAHAVADLHGVQTEIINLGGELTHAEGMVSRLRARETKNIVTIGLLASQLARRNLDNKIVVFCQVLNYEQFDLVTPWMKGVSALPSADSQFAAWRKLDPALQSVGLITGTQMNELVHTSQIAAEKLALRLENRVVSSGREVPSALSQLIGKIQGLWLVPDSSVLSTEVIRDTLTIALRNNIQVLAFTPALLKEGALLSATADEEDIARAVLSQFESLEKKGAFSHSSVITVDRAKIQINDKAAARFNLKVTVEGNSHGS